MNKKTVALHNLGCKVNAYETEAAAESFKNSGYEIVPFGPGADIYVINTCSVTNIADKKSRQMIHRARKMNPDAIVVAMGCYVQAKKDEDSDPEAADIIIGNNRKKDIAVIVNEYERRRQRMKIVGDLSSERIYEYLPVSETTDHVRSFMKVQDGCDMFCSYCIIPYVRGRVRSRDAADVKDEARRLAERGCREMVLSGIHLSSYGKDLKNGKGLADLVEEIHNVQGIDRIRLGSLEPGFVTEETAQRLAALPKLCPHFHLSLQSGCDRILKAMNRRYDTAQYRSKTEILRKYFDEPCLTTDIIAGFPGESEEDFRETLEFVDDISFFETHVFPFSARRGTKAAGMSGQLTEAVKKERASRLIALGNEKRRLQLEGLMGNTQEVLIEEEQEINGNVYWTGHTAKYERVAVQSGTNLRNKMVRVFVEGLLGEDSVYGSLR